MEMEMEKEMEMGRRDKEKGKRREREEKKETEYACQHYRRKCEFYTPCCLKTYRCRFCHDLSEEHVLFREDVQFVVCSVCKNKQEMSNQCNRCQTTFGEYYCFECKLFDDEDKQQFHCDGCGICRIGGRSKFFHCETCNMCLPSHLKGNHKCIENLSRANCPICQEDIHTSREPSQIPPCHHLIHKSCFEQLVQSGHFNCPICARSLMNMAEMWKAYDQRIEETPLPAIYQNLYVKVYCRDCSKTCLNEYHILGVKCSHCGSYNTVRDKGPLLRRNGNLYTEANLYEDDVIPSSGQQPIFSVEQTEAETASTSSSTRQQQTGDSGPREDSRVRIQNNSTESWDSDEGVGYEADGNSSDANSDKS